MSEQPLAMSAADYRLIKREILHEGFYQLVRYHVEHRFFNGKQSKPFTRDVLERPSSAAILLYDPMVDQVVLIEQFRAGVLAHSVSPWLIEIPAGTDDEDEHRLELAIREAKEEAGCDVLASHFICRYFPSPGAYNEQVSLYCGLIDIHAFKPGTYGLAEEVEDIRAFSVTLTEAAAMISAGQINTSPAIIALQWLQLNQIRLKQQWQKR